MPTSLPTRLPSTRKVTEPVTTTTNSGQSISSTPSGVELARSPKMLRVTTTSMKPSAPALVIGPSSRKPSSLQSRPKMRPMMRLLMLKPITPEIQVAKMVARKPTNATFAMMTFGPLYLSGMGGIRRFLATALELAIWAVTPLSSSPFSTSLRIRLASARRQREATG